MKRIELNADQQWLLHNAAADDNGPVSVGGLAYRLGLLASSTCAESATKAAFARLLEFRRRELGLTVEALAAKAHVELADLVTLEDDAEAKPESGTVLKLARALGLPSQRLMQLSGLRESEDEGLRKAAVRFAARSKPVEELSKAEHEALAELVSIMNEG